MTMVVIWLKVKVELWWTVKFYMSWFSIHLLRLVGTCPGSPLGLIICTYYVDTIAYMSEAFVALAYFCFEARLLRSENQ